MLHLQPTSSFQPPESRGVGAEPPSAWRIFFNIFVTKIMHLHCS